MARYSFRAATREGRTVAGVEDVPSAASLARALGERGLYPIAIVAAERPRSPQALTSGSRRTEAAEAIATLSVLLDAGLTLDTALEVAARGARHRGIAHALETARTRLREGGTLAGALAAAPSAFSTLAVGLVRAGETGGHLPDALHRLAEHLRRQREFQARLVSATLYPLLLLIVGAVAFLVLFLAVLPRFVVVLEDAGAELPHSTVLLMAVASLIRAGWPVALSGLGLVALAAMLARRSEEFRERIDELLLRLPWLGRLRSAAAVARLARTISLMSASGAPLVAALGIAAGAVGDAAMGRRLIRTREAVRRGEAWSAALRSEPAFPFSFVRMVEVGEESGRLAELLDRAASLCETEVERRLARLVVLLEPALILLLGLAVGFVALSLLQAIHAIHADTF